MLKKIWSSLPQLSLIIIILALLKNFLYYFNFHVPIKYFIGLSELGLLVAGDLFMLVPLFLLMYLFSLEDVTKKSIKKENTISDEKKAIPKPIVNKGKFSRLLFWVMPTIVMAFIILLMFVVPVVILFKSNSFSDKLLFGSMLIGEIVIIIFMAKSEMLEKLISSDGTMISVFITFFIMVFIAQTSLEIQSVEKGEYKGTKIITSDSTYLSTDSAFYIGQTTNFIFFYNKKDMHTTVIPTREVKKLELYSK